MPLKIFLFTPPFTQLNTPYPATAYLKGFLNTKKINSFQADIGIETILEIFSQHGLQKIFSEAPESNSANAQRIYSLRKKYIETVDIAVEFLQGKNPNFSYRIANRLFLPEASRFDSLQDMQWAYGSMGLHDKAKHIATLYLEDIADYIKECVDEHFGFSRYAEKIGRCANTFDELYRAIHNTPSFVDTITTQILQKHIETHTPDLVCISVPFPGNLYSAFRCAHYLKANFPKIKIALGGGFANTELRSLQDKRVFEFLDFITLDDGEAPLFHLIEYLENKRDFPLLKRTFTLQNDEVVFINGSLSPDYKQHETGTPDYSDLLFDKYISAVEIINPMHKLWSDGRWNKLTMAHGCYWGKCTFCDISLDYIQRYEPITASLICDRIEEIIQQTNERSFHFVDEAAPPSLMKAVALEIIRRKISINWWTNIRFEKSFTQDLCYLLKESGCIAVSGGLEVASDRLLTLIQKGVSVEGVTQVAHNFTKADILVHAYLMYGFPSQTAQETIDSMEVVRQMFDCEILKSGFWHQFAMTAHSPVGMNPGDFGVKKINETLGTFANNDIEYTDTKGAEAALFSEGLKVSLFNYMQGAGLALPLQKWFDFKIPNTSIEKDYIQNIIESNEESKIKWNSKTYWLYELPDLNFFTKSKKGNTWEMGEFTFQLPQKTESFSIPKDYAVWFLEILKKINISNQENISLAEIKEDYEKQNFHEDFELFWYNKIMKNLKGRGLVSV